MPGRRYGILANRIKRGSFDGFIYKEGNSIETVGSANEHMFALNAIDGVEKDSMWGRFFMKLEKSPNVVCNVYVYAGNEKCIYYDSEKIDIEEFFHESYKSIAKERIAYLSKVNIYYISEEKDRTRNVSSLFL